MNIVPVSPIKKTWQTPDFYLIAIDNVNNKNSPSVHEGTGHVSNRNGSKFFVNGGGSGFLLTNDKGVKFGYASSAVS